jgi:G3E family GTPase
MHKVTVLAGALGAGKTTVLQSMLAEDQSPDRITIINEVGYVSHAVAGFLVQEEQVTVLRGGCLCCLRRDDLVVALNDYATQVSPDLEATVLVELSGVADAGPVIHTILSDPFLSNHYHLEKVVAVVDATICLEPEAQSEMWIRQVSLADLCIVAKADLVEEEQLRAVEDLVVSTNPLTQVVQGWDGNLKASMRVRRKDLKARRAALADSPVATHGTMPDVTILELPAELEWGRFSVWLSLLLHRWGQDVLRLKGVVAGDPGQRTSVEAVHHVVYPPRHAVAATDDPMRNEIVLITQRLPTEMLTESLYAFLGIGYVAAR